MRNRLSAFVLAAALALSGISYGQDGQQPDPIGQRGVAAMQALFGGNPGAVSSEFNEEMAKALPAEAVAAIPGQIMGQAGKLTAIGQPIVQETGEGQKTVLVPLQFEQVRLIGRITYLLDGSSPKIAGLWLNPAEEEGLDPSQAAPEKSAGDGGPKIDLPKSSAPYVNAEKFREFPTMLLETLPSVLSVPVTASPDSPVPIVILVHGSGPADMNSTVAANRPFLDLAQGLASNGVAVYRYVKRTAIQPQIGSNRELTVQTEVIDDVLAAASVLRDAPGIDGSRVFVLGHSLGAFLAPEIAKQDGQLAGIIMLGGPTNLGPQTVLDQIAYLTANDTAAPNKAKEDAIALMKADMQELVDGKGVEGKRYTGAYKAYWEDTARRDPVATLKELTIPALLVFGERDYQVPISNATAWEKGLEGRKGVRVKTYPGLNHLMINGSGTPLPKEYEIPGYVSMDVVNDVSKFVLETKAAGLQF